MLSHAIALNLKPPSSFSAREGLEKTMRHMTSLGRYCKTGSLVGMYGAGSELVQGFCRHSAVHGGVFRLNMPLNGVEVSEDLEGYKFTVDAGQGEDRSVYRAKHLIASTDFAPSLQLTVET